MIVSILKFLIIFIGVGKSKTIEAMAKWSEHILLKEDHQSSKPRVLIAAFTGKAASLIGKSLDIFTSIFESIF